MSVIPPHAVQDRQVQISEPTGQHHIPHPLDRHVRFVTVGPHTVVAVVNLEERLAADRGEIRRLDVALTKVPVAADGQLFVRSGLATRVG